MYHLFALGLTPLSPQCEHNMYMARRQRESDSRAACCRKLIEFYIRSREGKEREAVRKVCTGYPSPKSRETPSINHLLIIEMSKLNGINLGCPYEVVAL